MVLVDGIREVDLKAVDESSFNKRFADAIVVTKDGALLLQHRPENWNASANYLTAFGGHLEDGESVLDGLCRELNEELGAVVNPEDVQFIGAVTEQEFDHKDIVYVHFWRDKVGSITGCYEAEPRYFDCVDMAFKHPQVMDYLKWALLTARERGLVQ